MTILQAIFLAWCRGRRVCPGVELGAPGAGAVAVGLARAGAGVRHDGALGHAGGDRRLFLAGLAGDDHGLGAGTSAPGLERPNARLAWLLVIGSIPAAVLGFVLEDWFESLFGEPAWVSLFLVATAAILLGVNG